jgi:hypothetical protein
MKLHDTSARLAGPANWLRFGSEEFGYLKRRGLADPELRHLRTGSVQAMARAYGEFYHGHDVAAELRHDVLEVPNTARLLRGIAWSSGGA